MREDGIFLYVNSGEVSGFPIAADCVDVPAEVRFSQNETRNYGTCREYQYDAGEKAKELELGYILKRGGEAI